LFCLSAAYLFTGCESGDNGVIVGLDPRLIGTWETEFFEKYIITDTHLTYTDFMGEVWGGTIGYAARFNSNTGIIVIRYDGDKKQQWPIYNASWEITGYHDTSGRDFYGIYFRNLTQNSFIPSNTSDQKDFGPSETATLQQAINRFTLDNMPDWMDASFAIPAIKQ